MSRCLSAGLLLAALVVGGPDRLLAETLPSPMQLAGTDRGAAGYLDPLPSCLSELEPEAKVSEVGPEAKAPSASEETDLEPEPEAGAPQPPSASDPEAGAPQPPSASDLEAGAPRPPAASDPEATDDLAAAIRAARRNRPREAVRGLARAIRAHPASPTRVCALLELARIELRGWRGREALATLARARHDLDGFDPPLSQDPDGSTGPRSTDASQGPRSTDASQGSRLRDRLDHAWAEALALLGRDAEARPLLQALEAGSDPALAWAAGMRRVERDPDADWERLEPWVERGRQLDQDLDSWALRIAELAIAAQHFDAALYWITRAEVYPHGDLASLRKADVLVGLGREEEATVLLRRFAERGDRRLLREIAALRLAEHGLAPADDREALLALAAASAAPAVASAALRLAVQDALDSRDLDAALASLARLRQLVLPEGSEDLRGLTTRLLEQATAADEDCTRVVLRLGELRQAWARAAERPAPLVRLGDCALELGLARLAADVFRTVARRFPEELGPRLAYRIARTALDVGERATAEALLAANRERAEGEEVEPGSRAPWLWLETRLALADGRPRAAFEGMQRLLSAPDTPAPERVAAERALLALPQGVASPEELREALQQSLVVELPEDVAEPAGRAVARLRLADLLEAAGARQDAHEAYAEAVATLPAGPLRDRARYALAWLAPDPETRLERLRRLADSEDDPAWAALARSELRIEDLDRLLDGLRRSGL